VHGRIKVKYFVTHVLDQTILSFKSSLIIHTSLLINNVNAKKNVCESMKAINQGLYIKYMYTGCFQGIDLLRCGLLTTKERNTILAPCVFLSSQAFGV
jgi:hypothetical protein